MKYAFLILLLLTCIAAHAQQPAQPIDGTDCSNLFFKALTDENDKALSALLANDFAVTSFDGQVVDGERLQQAVAEGYIIVNSGILTGANTRMYGDVAVVTGQWSLDAKVADNSFRGELAYMSVCVKSGGIWKISALQLTPLR